MQVIDLHNDESEVKYTDTDNSKPFAWSGEIIFAAGCLLLITVKSAMLPITQDRCNCAKLVDLKRTCHRDPIFRPKPDTIYNSGLEI